MPQPCVSASKTSTWLVPVWWFVQGRPGMRMEQVGFEMHEVLRPISGRQSLLPWHCGVGP